jgi:S1-C subfamily serine protease
LSDEEIAEKLRPSTVLVLAQFAETAINPEGIGGGTGIVYNLDKGYILTNAHVVEGASIVKVATANGTRTRPARVVGRSQCDDLAVLKVDDTSGLQEARLGDTNSMKVGAHVVALGYPEMFELGNDLTVTTGSISKLHAQRYQHEDLIQTNAAITHGSSGGPLVNSKGEVIGINTLGFYTNQGEREPGINFAISISHVKPIIAQLEQGKNHHYTGLNLYPNVFAEYFGTTEGIVVIGVASGSPAAQVGVQPADLLLKIEGTSVASEENVCDILRSHGDGDQLKMTLYRATTGEVLEGELTLGRVGAAGGATNKLSVIGRVDSNQGNGNQGNQGGNTATQTPQPPQPPTPTTGTTEARFGDLKMQRPSRVSASGIAPSGRDSQGNIVSYEPGNAVDGQSETTWRVAGDGTGQFLLLEFSRPIRVSEVRMIPGYAKVDPSDGTDRFTQNRRVQRVRFEFSDGSSSEASFADSRDMQSAQVKPAVTTFVRIVILQTTPPGAGDGRDFTPISEVAVIGQEQLP